MSDFSNPHLYPIISIGIGYSRTDDEMIDDIRMCVTKGDLYGQLAEECCELAKAALKAQRYLQGTNPPAQSSKEIMANLHEEVSDVTLVLEVANLKTKPDTMQAKLRRWHKRLNVEGAKEYGTDISKEEL